MSRDLLLGVDVGTSSLKAVTTDMAGGIAGTASFDVPLDMPGGGRCEVDPRAYWYGLRSCCRDLATSGVDLGRVRALAVAAHAETLIPVDEHLEPLCPAIVWVDTRSGHEADELAARFGSEELALRSGQPEMLPMWPATKLLWFQRHEPEIAREVRWWLQPLDYLTARLTGTVATDYSEYSSSLLLDIRACAWWEPMLDALNIDDAALPALVPAGTALGPIVAGAADELGLPQGVIIVMGGFDQACTAVGAGNVREGIVSESTGSSLAVVSTVHDVPPPSSKVPCHLHVVPDHYFLCAHSPSGGSAYAWVRARFAPELTFEELDAAAASAQIGADGVVLLPTFSGTATPTFAPQARAVLFGLTLDHDAARIARAALEGVAFTLSGLIDEGRRLGIEPYELRSVGGGARSAVWGQIKADVTGLPVRVPEVVDHAGALGAAIVAGAGSGFFSSIADGADRLVRLARTFEPDPVAGTRYEHARAVHSELYPRLADLFRQEPQ
jgi:sugar (pentulose or hexulose) kinase